MNDDELVRSSANAEGSTAKRESGVIQGSEIVESTNVEAATFERGKKVNRMETMQHEALLYLNEVLLTSEKNKIERSVLFR